MPKTETGKDVVLKSKGSKFQWPRFRMPHKYVMYDKIHRGTVFFMVSAVVIILVRMGVDVTHYYRVRNPIMTEIARIDKEAQMEAMQKEREKALTLQQKLQEEADKV